MDLVPDLGGSLVAVATPLRDNAPDLAALARLCERQVVGGTSGIVVCGSTGEAAALDATEFFRIVRAAAEAVRGRVPVIAGCTASATSTAVMLAADAARAGADALLCAPPPYVRPTQDGIAAHLRAVAHAADLPLIAYDVPGRCGVGIADATLAALSAAGLVAAVKDATGDLSRPPRLRALCGPALVQLSGDDATAAAHRAMGGAGCISVTANVAPALCAALHRAWDARDLDAFARLRDLLDPLHAALFAESNPIPLKAALEALGLCDGAVRLPLTRATPATRARLDEVLARVMPTEQRAGVRAAAPLYAVAG